MIAGLDALLTTLHVEPTDRIIASPGLARSGPSKRPEVTDGELVCLAVEQVLLRHDSATPGSRAGSCPARSFPGRWQLAGSPGDQPDRQDGPAAD